VKELTAQGVPLEIAVTKARTAEFGFTKAKIETKLGRLGAY
jgi:hypothetical protein